MKLKQFLLNEIIRGNDSALHLLLKAIEKEHKITDFPGGVISITDDEIDVMFYARPDAEEFELAVQFWKDGENWEQIEDPHYGNLETKIVGCPSGMRKGIIDNFDIDCTWYTGQWCVLYNTSLRNGASMIL